MRKLYFILPILAIVLLPSFSSAATVEELQAQISALLAQLQSLQSQLAQIQGQPAVWCHDFNVNLKIGDKGNEISLLRAALAKEGFEVFNPQENPYESSFDEDLASAVTGLQEKYKDEILTPLGLKYGTGFAGKATRAKLNHLYGCVKPIPPPFCAQVSVICESTSKIVCPSGLDDKGCPFPCKCVPVVPCAEPACQIGYQSYDTGEKDSNGCPIKKCIPPTENQPPVIHGVSGPTTLKVNETGTWIVKASDPEQGILTYFVLWGDEGAFVGPTLVPKSTVYVQTATFTHSYSKAAIYNPTFTVTDDKGLSVKTSISVNVGEVTACTDTDGGKNYSVKGTVTVGSLSYTDSCDYCTGLCQVGQTCPPVICGAVVEYYCEGNTIKSETHVCGSGYTCSNGACIPTALSITTASLSSGTVGTSYSASISASGGSDSYIWSVSSGALPPGLNLSNPVCIAWPCQAPASISGTPTTAGSYTFTITVKSGTQTASKQFTISIAAAGTCADTDNGKNYYVKGTITKGIVSYTDECAYCTGFYPSPVTCGAVKEYYCENNEIKSETYVCPSGNTCEDGACIVITTPSITVLSPNENSQLEQMASVLESAQKILDQISQFLKTQ